MKHLSKEETLFWCEWIEQRERRTGKYSSLELLETFTNTLSYEGSVKDFQICTNTDAGKIAVRKYVKENPPLNYQERYMPKPNLGTGRSAVTYSDNQTIYWLEWEEDGENRSSDDFYSLDSLRVAYKILSKIHNVKNLSFNSNTTQGLFDIKEAFDRSTLERLEKDYQGKAKQFEQCIIEPEEWDKIIMKIFNELGFAMEKFREFPCDPIHAVSIMNEEAGESIRATLLYVYENGTIEDIKKELIQTAAMCIRVLHGINSNNIKK